jgi:hypothetical protein
MSKGGKAMSRRVTVRHAVVVVFLALTPTVGCASHPTADDAMRSFFGAWCSDLSRCDATTFEAMFPQGGSAAQGACVDQLVGGVKGVDHDALDACTTSELDTCVGDIHKESCDAFVTSEVGLLAGAGASALPRSCGGC